MSAGRWDAVIVGSGPNGLAAAITIARAGRRVLVLEAKDEIGGGSRTKELTLPGFRHDVCSAVHPLGASSPFFARLPLDAHGLEWLEPPVQLAHPFDDGSAAVLLRSVAATAASLGPDAARYRRIMAPLVRDWPKTAPALLGPVLRLPAHPIALTRFGLPALLPAERFARLAFRGAQARALFGGIAAHSMVPLSKFQTASFGLVLGVSGHACGWPLAKGGSQTIADALASYLRSLGGELECGRRVASLHDLPPARAALFDVTPAQLAAIAGDALGGLYGRMLRRYRYGNAVFKLDYALSGPVPWTAEGARRAGTVHLAGPLDAIVRSEQEASTGRPPDRPLVLVAQPSVVDPSRAPEGRHVLWAYCHMPRGSSADMTEHIERQIDRFAPGWRDLVLARAAITPAALQAYNPNNVGGDIAGGASDGLQLLFRPVPKADPYRTNIPGVYLCSASTPPGGGVHGMCGYWAARSALRNDLGASRA